MATVSIPLSQGKCALIDGDDLPLVEGLRWHAYRDGRVWYAERNVWEGPRRLHQKMHRVILDAPAGIQVDHINGDGLDNRRCNLRLATRSQNGSNRRSKLGSSSSYLGVSLRRNGTWRAQIAKHGKTVWLGAFKLEEDAARAYDEAAKAMHGEFARLNFPDEIEAA